MPAITATQFTHPNKMTATIPAQMLAMTIRKHGQNPVEKTIAPVPSIRDCDVLVKIHAASINPVDFKIRDGKLRLILPLEMPLILGNDFAGVVAAVGKNVENFSVGDAVFGRIDKERPNHPTSGTFAEFCAVSEGCLAHKPANLGFNQAASLPLVALTAYQALTERMHVKAGDRVLIHAGAGGLGSVAIQVAKNLGLWVAATASGKGVDLVKSLGADEVMDYRQSDFSKNLRGLDAVLDTIGGETLMKCFGIVKKGGVVVSVSATPNAAFADEWGLAKWKKWLFRLACANITRAAKKHGANYDFLFMRPSGEQLMIIKDWVESGKLKPVIDKTFPFDDAQKAIEYQQTGRAKGKVVLEIIPQ